MMTEELLKALQTIKKECEKQDVCDDCPMSNSEGFCGVKQVTPNQWKLEKREVYF